MEYLSDSVFSRIDEVIDCLHAMYPDDLDKPGEILGEVLDGTASLHLIDNGFAILKVHAGELLVWAAASFTGNTNSLINSITTVESIAREAGIKAVYFGSPRKGWERVAPKLGYTRQGDYFRKEVN